MKWIFTLIRERDNVQLVTPDPIGWDSAKVSLARDTTKHGIAFDFSIGALQFLDDAAIFIKDEYDAYCSEGRMLLVIQQDCDGTLTELTRGNLDFGQYQYFSGIRCYVQIALETTSDVMTLNNRSDQKVDLETLVSFDGVALAPYNALGMKMTLKAKTIPVSDHAVVDDGTEASEVFTSGLQAPYNINDPVGTPTNLNINQLSLGFNKTVSAEIGNFFTATPVLDQLFNGGNDGNFGTTFLHPVPGSLIDTVQIYPLGSSPIINYTEDSPSFNQLSATSRLRMQFRGSIENPLTYINVPMAFLIGILPRSTRSDSGTKDSDYTWVYQQMINDSVDVNSFFPPNSTINMHLDPIDINLTLNPGDRVYMFITITNRSTQAQINQIEADTSKYAFKAIFDDSTSFLLENASNGGTNPQTDIKSFLINESLSRVAEAITNDRIRVYSDYFGRATTAQPYPSPVTGCGAMALLTNGLFLRAIDQARTDTPPILSLSLDDLWDGLNPIHNIGFGIEDDPNRPGYKMLRVERWEYFYKDDLVFSCDGVEILNEAATPSRIYSIFKFGFNKWEAEAFTGLDEFLTKREYRTSLTGVQNTLTTLSTFVASGYAIEITRRLGNDTSKDSSYDNDTFIICVKDNSAHGTFGATEILESAQPQLFQVTATGIGLFLTPALVGSRVKVNIGGDIHYGTFSDWSTNNVVFITLPDLTTNPPIQPVQIDYYSYAVEQGGITDPANMVDPDTILNFRISPNRNAIRWANVIFQSYRNAADRQMLFTDGEGNFYAEGQLTDACAVESAVLKENQTIGTAIIKDTGYKTPLISPETITFDYPISAKDFNYLKQNRLGLIEYSTPQGSGQGWLLSLQLIPSQGGGIATFTLIKKYGS